jgi:hypothetical protein
VRKRILPYILNFTRYVAQIFGCVHLKMTEFIRSKNVYGSHPENVHRHSPTQMVRRLE